MHLSQHVPVCRLRVCAVCVLLQGHFAKVMLCLAPLGFAAFITMSRVAAYKHDWSDVNAGFIIGMWSGFLAYLINYQK